MSESSKTIKTAIVDDEPMGRAALRSLLNADSEIELVSECANGLEALDAVRAGGIDLMFLDVQMPGLTGFQVLEELSEEKTPVIVFVTAYDQYALRAFDVHAVDYLLKPFDDERFEAALKRAKNRLHRDAVVGVGRQLADLLAAVSSEGRALAPSEEGADHELQAQTGPLTRLSIHRGGRVDYIDTQEVIWVEAADQYVCLHTDRGEFLMRESMSFLERGLDPARFMRVHRSAIVAMDCIRSLESLGGGSGRALIGGDTWVPVSRSRMAAVKERLN